jgi:hypothetical protein
MNFSFVVLILGLGFIFLSFFLRTKKENTKWTLLEEYRKRKPKPWLPLWHMRHAEKSVTEEKTDTKKTP